MEEADKRYAHARTAAAGGEVRKQGERYLTLDEIRRIPWDHYPIFMYSDGGSLFSWLIRKADDSAGSHLWTLVGNDAIANQSITFRLVPVAQMAHYTTKLIWNPEFTPEQRKTMLESIFQRLELPWYRRLYDVVGLIGEVLERVGIRLNLGKFDFCSESVSRAVALVDPEFRAWLEQNPSPTPKEFNLWTKAHNPPWKVYGRYAPDD
jgi:hypothetical protein